MWLILECENLTPSKIINLNGHCRILKIMAYSRSRVFKLFYKTFLVDCENNCFTMLLYLLKIQKSILNYNPKCKLYINVSSREQMYILCYECQRTVIPTCIYHVYRISSSVIKSEVFLPSWEWVLCRTLSRFLSTTASH